MKLTTLVASLVIGSSFVTGCSETQRSDGGSSEISKRSSNLTSPPAFCWAHARVNLETKKIVSIGLPEEGESDSPSESSLGLTSTSTAPIGVTGYPECTQAEIIKMEKDDRAYTARLPGTGPMHCAWFRDTPATTFMLGVVIPGAISTGSGKLSINAVNKLQKQGFTVIDCSLN